MLTLREKFRGCIAATWTGSAMGAAVEGWPPERISEEHGVLDRLLPYCHYAGRTETDWHRPPGTTEDGIERQRLIATAIIEKKGRITAQDLVRVWLRDLAPAKSLYKQEPYDTALLELARAGVPAELLGSLGPHADNVGPTRSSHPIGLVNAGDPDAAADDVFDVERVYFPRTAYGLRWAALYCAAVAEACSPGATVESVLETALGHAAYRAEEGDLYTGYDKIAREVPRALEIGARHTDVRAMREEFQGLYRGGEYFMYGYSQASEVVSKGLAVFALTKGNPREAIVAAVNFGRDTDCLAAVAGGLAGALSGPESIPPEWIEQVNEATRQDPYTNCRRTIEETADGLHEAFMAKRKRLEDYLQATGAPGFLA